MNRAPLMPWLVAAAWAGWMVGVWASVRPAHSAALTLHDAKAHAAAWSGRLADAPSGPPALWVGRRPCACDDADVEQLVRWAQASGLAVHDAAGQAGIALADASGRLRYAGEAGALRAHCGGRHGLEAWIHRPALAPIVTAPCPCE